MPDHDWQEDWEYICRVQAQADPQSELQKVLDVSIYWLLQVKDLMKSLGETDYKLLDSDANTWECQYCGLVWCFDEGNPFENSMTYCPECGRYISQSIIGNNEIDERQVIKR